MAESYSSVGWYVVVDEDDCVILQRYFRDQASRNYVETCVAQELVPGTRYGFGWSLQEALNHARGIGGSTDVSTDTEGG